MACVHGCEHLEVAELGCGEMGKVDVQCTSARSSCLWLEGLALLSIAPLLQLVAWSGSPGCPSRSFGMDLLQLLL